MRFDWATRAGVSLRPRHEERLSELYHENSKLFPEVARQQSAEFSVSPSELYLMSRGFRQYSGATTIALPDIQESHEALQDVMLRRRSSRDLQGSITLAELATILTQGLGPTAIVRNEDFGISQALRSWPSAGGLYPIDAYVIASKVEGVNSGIYHYNSIAQELELLPTRPVADVLRDGFFWQEFVLSAAVTILLVAVFDRSIAKYGERGYRLILLDAGHAAQNVLLTAEQLRIGAVPVAGFYDDGLAADLQFDGLSEAVVHSLVMGKSSE